MADQSSQDRPPDSEGGRTFSLGEAWVAGMVVTAPFAPAIAMAVTLLIYVVRTMRQAAAGAPGADAAARAALEVPVAGVGHQALLHGLFLGLAIWIVVGLLARPFVGIAGANRSVYRDLRGRVNALDLDLQAVTRQSLSPDSVTRTDVSEVMSQRNELSRELGLTGKP